jgi:hypothetical protein
VESILQEDTKQESKEEGYLDITILTNDISFFSDEKEASHKRSLGAFWDRLKAKFQASKIRKLQIVLATTGTQVLTVDNQDAEVENRALIADSDDAADAFAHVEAMVRKRGIDVAQCLRAIQDHIEKRGQADFKENRSLVQFGQTTAPPVDLKFWKIDGSSIGFKSLLRMWSQEHSPGPQRILFDLPETLNGTQCSVSLDVSYKTMPFRFDSAPASRLLRDMELLSQSKLEVLQLVPIPLIDATLLYGIVMSARAALESDIEQHHEMALLVRSLLTKLSQKDCALLLRSEGPADTDESLFHQNRQLFLLMVEEIPASLQGKIPPSSCILHRYACAEHILLETGTKANFDDLENQYSELVESSLDCLQCSTVNPLYLDATRSWSIPISRYSTSNGVKSQGDSEWTDDTGVGSRTEAHTDFSGLSSGDPSTRKRPTGHDKIWTDTTGVGSRAVEDKPNSEEISDIDIPPVKPTTQKKGKQRTAKMTTFGAGALQLLGPDASSNNDRKEVSAVCLEHDISSGFYSSPSSDASSVENDPLDLGK